MIFLCLVIFAWGSGGGPEWCAKGKSRNWPATDMLSGLGNCPFFLWTYKVSSCQGKYMFLRTPRKSPPRPNLSKARSPLSKSHSTEPDDCFSFCYLVLMHNTMVFHFLVSHDSSLILCFPWSSLNLAHLVTFPTLPWEDFFLGWSGVGNTEFHLNLPNSKNISSLWNFTFFSFEDNLAHFHLKNTALR